MTKGNKDHSWKKYQAVYWSEDIKPKGKWKRLIQKSGRQHAKQEIRKCLNQ